MKKYNTIIIGAGAAGLKAAAEITANGKSCLILDMGNAPARKITVSGGGRCNFTNADANVSRYFGKNPKFVKSAFAAVKPEHILQWAQGHGLNWIEKTAGQYFCASGANDIVDALLSDCKAADIKTNIVVSDVQKINDKFIVNNCWESTNLIVATGGVSYPNLGVSDIGYKIAKQFGHKIIPTSPGLVALKTDLFPIDLAGVSMPVEITIGKNKIVDAIMFTHFGIGGPAVYRASLYDLKENDLFINFMPNTDIKEWLETEKRTNGKQSVHTILSKKLPTRFAKSPVFLNKNIADVKKDELLCIVNTLNNFCIKKDTLKSRGFLTAEVTIGGVATDDVSSKSFESGLCGGLYFVGEVLDVTGDLGGFNLHWAFASGIIAGKSVI